MELNAEYSDKDIENVVREIFKDIDQSANHISSHSVLELVATFVNREGSEYELLEKNIKKLTIDGVISKTDMKSAISEWIRSLKINDDLSLFDNPEFKSISYSPNKQFEEVSIDINITNQESHLKYITELEKKLIFKENVIINLKCEVQHLSQQVQLHEELYRTVVSEKNQLMEKNQKNLCNSVSYDEYNDLKESFQLLKNNKKQLQQKIDNVKAENNNLYKNISDLENERQHLSHLLTTTEKKKEKILESLYEAKSYIEELKNDCMELNGKILQQEIIIKNLLTAKECLELELNTIISKSTSKSFSLKKYRDNSSETRYSDDVYDESIASELKKLNYPITSTPRNNTSLLDELKESCLTTCDVNDFSTFTVDKIDEFHTNSEDIHVDEVDFSQSIDDITSNFQSQCTNEVVSSNIPLTVALLKNQIDVQTDLHESISDKFADNTNVISTLKSEIDNLNSVIVNMKECISLSDTYCHNAQNAMKNVNTKTKVLLYLMKENCIWIGQKHNDILRHVKTKNSSMTSNNCGYVNNNFEKNLLDLEKAKSNRSNFKSTKIKKSSIFSKILTCCKYVIFAVLFLFLLLNVIFYSTMVYCNRRGNKIYILPWDWIGVDELMLSIFKFNYDGKVPI